MAQYNFLSSTFERKFMSPLSRFPWKILILSCFSLFLCVGLSDQADAKRKRKPTPSPVKILDVTLSPDPFVIGQTPLTFSMVVQMPSSLKGDRVLEVTVLITSPTRRSMSFVTHRRVLSQHELLSTIPTFPIEVIWDGKDQHEEWVADGAYAYDIQAKLMEDAGEGPRTKIVSRRFHGTLEALAYVGEVIPPLLEESEEPEELEGESEEALADDVPVVEEGLKITEETAPPQEEMNGEPSGLVPSISSGQEMDELTNGGAQEVLQEQTENEEVIFQDGSPDEQNGDNPVEEDRPNLRNQDPGNDQLISPEKTSPTR